MDESTPGTASQTRGATSSRRQALALMLGASPWLSTPLAAGDATPPLRLAISESLVADVNMNDARAAMLVWIKQITADLNIVVEFDQKVFVPTGEILLRARKGQLDAVALNIIEYRQLMDVLDSKLVIATAGARAAEQYILLAKRNRGIQQLSHLRGHRLCAWKAPRMCVANAWLAAILDEGHLGPSEQFFGSMTVDPKASRVVLPVFFGQSDACLLTKRSFDTMCELNPQIANDLTVIATSPPMVVNFYIFHKNYQSANREKFVTAIAGLRKSLAGRQLATLFQFEDFTRRDAGCLASALSVLDMSDRARKRLGAGNRKG
jgi:ABC-type phosphate/phosphonate transport system substrate-binding protein